MTAPETGQPPPGGAGAATASWILGDGSWIDVAVVGAAVVAMAIRALRMRAAGLPVERGPLLNDALNAASLVPFLVLIPVVAFSGVIDSLKQASRVSFSLAGIMGAVWVAGELLKPTPRPPPPSPGSPPPGS